MYASLALILWNVWAFSLNDIKFILNAQTKNAYMNEGKLGDYEIHTVYVFAAQHTF